LRRMIIGFPSCCRVKPLQRDSMQCVAGFRFRKENIELPRQRLARTLHVHCKSQSESEIVFHKTFRNADLWRRNDLGTAFFELRMERVDGGDPHIGVETGVAWNGVMRGAGRGVRFSQLNFCVVAGDAGEDRQLTKKAQDAKSEEVPIVLRGSDHIGHYKLWSDGLHPQSDFCSPRCSVPAHRPANSTRGPHSIPEAAHLQQISWWPRFYREAYAWHETLRS
jgi:hypothetical protein